MGGFLDIDATVVGPTGTIQWSVQKETEGKFSFLASNAVRVPVRAHPLLSRPPLRLFSCGALGPHSSHAGLVLPVLLEQALELQRQDGLIFYPRGRGRPVV